MYDAFYSRSKQQKSAYLGEGELMIFYHCEETRCRGGASLVNTPRIGGTWWDALVMTKQTITSLPGRRQARSSSLRLSLL